MYKTSEDPRKDHGRHRALQLLREMQTDYERGTFRLEKYTREVPTDVIPYLWEWIAQIGPTLKPATRRDYENSIKNHLEPFFKRHPVQLHEIQLDLLTKLQNSINRSGKGKLNVMGCLHACLDYAWRSQRIPAVPPFPKRKTYQIPRSKPVWLPEERQIHILNQLPEEHAPIFWWLKLHYRRPGEAQALHKDDLKLGPDGYYYFHVHRTFSARRLVSTTKTGYEHEIPMVQEFEHWLEVERAKQRRHGIISPYLFVNPYGKLPGKYYTNNYLNGLWHTACRAAGEKIDLYTGLKHSSCGQFLNEKGGTISELQAITDHARLESVKRYGQMEIARRRELMERKQNFKHKFLKEKENVV
jgi:hypothetical protein